MMLAHHYHHDQDPIELEGFLLMPSSSMGDAHSSVRLLKRPDGFFGTQISHIFASRPCESPVI
jgi:hypothetical protein